MRNFPWYPNVDDLVVVNPNGTVTIRTFSCIFVVILAYALGRGHLFPDWPIDKPNAHPILQKVVEHQTFALHSLGITAVTVYGTSAECYISGINQNGLLNSDILSANTLQWYSTQMAYYAQNWVQNGSVGVINWVAFELNLRNLNNYDLHLGLLTWNAQRTLLVQNLRAVQAATNPQPLPPVAASHVPTSNTNSLGGYVPPQTLLDAVGHNGARASVRQIQSRTRAQNPRRNATRAPPSIPARVDISSRPVVADHPTSAQPQAHIPNPSVVAQINPPLHDDIDFSVILGTLGTHSGVQELLALRNESARGRPRDVVSPEGRSVRNTARAAVSDAMSPEARDAVNQSRTDRRNAMSPEDRSAANAARAANRAALSPDVLATANAARAAIHNNVSPEARDVRNSTRAARRAARDPEVIAQENSDRRDAEAARPAAARAAQGAANRAVKPHRNSARSEIGQAVDVQQHYLGLMEEKCHDCGAMMWKDEQAKAKHKTGCNAGKPCYSMCCAKGKVVLEPQAPPPEFLAQLLTGHTQEARDFRADIRGYNCSLSMASLGAKLDTNFHGYRPFRISGVVHHLMGPLIPNDNGPPQFAQLYIIDGQAETEGRLNLFQGLSRNVMQGLQDMLHRVNPFVRAFKQAAAVDDAAQVHVILRGTETPDQRRYNLPKTPEIAAYMPDAQIPVNQKRDIVVVLRDGRVLRIDEFNSAYMALHYPLLFPRGELGYCLGIPIANTNADNNTAGNDNENAREANYPDDGMLRRPIIDEEDVVDDFVAPNVAADQADMVVDPQVPAADPQVPTIDRPVLAVDPQVPAVDPQVPAVDPQVPAGNPHVPAASGVRAADSQAPEPANVRFVYPENDPRHEPVDNGEDRGEDCDGEPPSEGEEDQDGNQPRRGKKKKTVTCMQYASYRLQVRAAGVCLLLHSCRLMHEYAVDCYAQVEGQRLLWLRLNQTKIRADLYSGVRDAVLRGDNDAAALGKRTVLPSSFIGGPRHMHQLYQDCMAIVRKRGKPDLFITFTCNPKWREITESLHPHQVADDRPDLCARVFRMKMKEMMFDLTHRHVLGRVIGDIHVIEFQKRGLPHAHILLILASEDKLRGPDDYDRVICAELPDSEAEPELYATVSRNMIHGPCCERKPDAQCMKDGHCTKRYPKAFAEATTENSDGYPSYRRRDNGRFVMKGPELTAVKMDNQHVVPYNAWLSKKYNAHINVEFCASIRAVKYLFKYVYKGHDRAQVRFQEGLGPDGNPAVAPVDVDEIDEYREGRYVGACEAFWRLFHFPLHCENPTTVRLNLHLENEQGVVFNPNANLAAIVAAPPKTMLTEWFVFNKKTRDDVARSLVLVRDQEVRVAAAEVSREEQFVRAAFPSPGAVSGPESPLAVAEARLKLLTENLNFMRLQHLKVVGLVSVATYMDFPSKHVWNVSTKVWTQRKNLTPAIGRMYSVSPSQGEKYYLRLLLCQVGGSTSYESMRTVNGVVYPTFQDTCKQLGLLDDDTEWDTCLTEASTVMMPVQIRELFAALLLFNNPADTLALWDKHKLACTDDILQCERAQTGVADLPISQEMYDEALRRIDVCLRPHGKTLANYPHMPIPPAAHRPIGAHAPYLDDHLRYDRPALAARVARDVPLLNPGQRELYVQIMSAVGNPLNLQGRHSNAFFLDSPGGCGKTHLFNLLLASVRSEGRVGLGTATSGIAALLLDGGGTAHSRFGIPIVISDKEKLSSIKIQHDKGKLLQMASIIIWDEAPMAHRNCHECLDALLRDIMKSDVPFGGKVVIFGGDFRQVLPVVPRGTKEKILAATIHNSTSEVDGIWPHITKISLTENMRVQRAIGADREVLRDWALELLRIGEGRTEDPMPVLDCMRPVHAVVPCPHYFTQDPSHLIALVFGDLSEGNVVQRRQLLISRAILTPKNDGVDMLNEMATASFPGEATVYLSADKLDADENCALFPNEFLNTLQPQGMPAHKLSLKVGAPIMLLRNMNPSIGLANGTRLIVHRLLPHMIQAEIVTGSHVGRMVMIPRIPLMPSDNDMLPFKFTRRQFPVRAAFAMTINKSQGQTFEQVGIYLPAPCFSHGQLYVAISRVGNPAGVIIMIVRNVLDVASRILDGFTRNVVYPEVFRRG